MYTCVQVYLVGCSVQLSAAALVNSQDGIKSVAGPTFIYCHRQTLTWEFPSHAGLQEGVGLQYLLQVRGLLLLKQIRWVVLDHS